MTWKYDPFSVLVVSVSEHFNNTEKNKKIKTLELNSYWLIYSKIKLPTMINVKGDTRIEEVDKENSNTERGRLYKHLSQTKYIFKC